MNEIRVKKIELDVFHLHKRADDCDARHGKTTEQLLAVDKRVDVLTENTNAVVHLTETVNNLIEALTFISKIAKAILVIGAACTAVWVALKHLWDRV
jgi:hypothetical protein